MSLADLLNGTCVINRRAPGTVLDADGNLSGTTTTQGTVSCSLQQVQRQEPGDAGEFSVTEWKLFLPTGTAIDTTDTVTKDGSTYEVVGDPWDAQEGSSAVWHVEATVKKTG